MLSTENHTQVCLIHAALAVQTIIDNLQGVESIAFLDIFSRIGLLYWRSLCGHLSQQNVVLYGAYTEILNIELCMYKTLRFSKNCKLRHGWPVYNFLTITHLLKPGSLTIELYTKFCVDPCPKRKFH